VTTTQGLASRWATFTVERHPPLSHLGMAAAFALGNAGMAVAAASVGPDAGDLALATILAAVFFFRLRLFDEIKDHPVDVLVNPDRPLARGLVRVGEARRAVWLLAALELAIVAVTARAALAAWAGAFLYSVAMYREFGIGAWLRPRLELYALTHTMVAAGVGVVVASIALGAPLHALPSPVWLFAPANWALFNVFEFSRKTFASTEERAGVESYSSRWGPRGAVILSLGWCGVALSSLVVAGTALVPGPALRAGAGLFGGAALLLALPFAVRARAPSARWLRAGMSIWAAALYAAIGIVGLGGPR
jgi:4-hydroxybenzoate polyprenyltransferase